MTCLLDGQPREKSIRRDLVREALLMLKHQREADMRNPFFRDYADIQMACAEDSEVIDAMLGELEAVMLAGERP